MPFLRALHPLRSLDTGTEKRLVFPWAKGLKVDDILAYYEENPHDDWTYADPGWSIDYSRQGQLALRGVAVPGLGTAQAVKPLGGR